jgi:hypothetical protein
MGNLARSKSQVSRRPSRGVSRRPSFGERRTHAWSRAVLFVGLETPEEFREALKRRSRGDTVFVVNPRETDATHRFRMAGGSFLRTRIEDLPSRFRTFDLIRENYPYPSGRHCVPPEPFAVARFNRLAPGGYWILYTESVRLASLLKAVVDYDPKLIGRFEVSLTRIPFEAAPRSSYPANDVRYKLIFRRLY